MLLNTVRHISGPSLLSSILFHDGTGWGIGGCGGDTAWGSHHDLLDRANPCKHSRVVKAIWAWFNRLPKDFGYIGGTYDRSPTCQDKLLHPMGDLTVLAGLTIGTTQKTLDGPPPSLAAIGSS